MALTFAYTTCNNYGNLSRGEIAADSIILAEKKLLDLQIPVVDIWRKDGKKTKVASLRNRDIANFAAQMQTTQEIQMKIVPSLELCIESSKSVKLSKVLTKVKELVESSGVELWDAMKRTNSFDELVIGLIKAGESAGFLDKAFEQVKKIYERNEEVKRKVIGVMTYPAIVICVAIGAIYLLMLKTVPVFVGLYSEAGMELPMPTQVLITMSNFTTQAPIQMGLASLGLIIFVILIPKFYRKFSFTHGFALKIPIIGMLIKKSTQATFCRTLADMLRAQSKLIDALSYCRSISVNTKYRTAIARATIAISAGGTATAAFKKYEDIFGLTILRAISFGEQVGKLDEILTPLGNSLDRELSEYVDKIKVLLEPALTILIGGVTMFIMAALFIPVFSMSKLI